MATSRTLTACLGFLLFLVKFNNVTTFLTSEDNTILLQKMESNYFRRSVRRARCLFLHLDQSNCSEFIEKCNHGRARTRALKVFKRYFLGDYDQINKNEEIIRSEASGDIGILYSDFDADFLDLGDRPYCKSMTITVDNDFESHLVNGQKSASSYICIRNCTDDEVTTTELYDNWDADLWRGNTFTDEANTDVYEGGNPDLRKGNTFTDEANTDVYEGGDQDLWRGNTFTDETNTDVYEGGNQDLWKGNTKDFGNPITDEANTHVYERSNPDNMKKNVITDDAKTDVYEDSKPGFHILIKEILIYAPTLETWIVCLLY
ncbi:Uncharacterised protein r2_g2071 [Pycnogonum litorale]